MDLADHLVVEVLDDVEVAEHRLDPRTLLLEGFLEIGVHITDHSLYGSHPLEDHMVDEVVDHLLLLLPMGDPEDMLRVKVYDVGGVPVTVMELEFVYGEYSCWLLRTDQFRAVDGVEILQALQGYVFDRVFAKTGNLGHLLLERVSPKRQKATGILPELHGYLAALRLERYRLAYGSAGSGRQAVPPPGQNVPRRGCC